MICLKNVTKVFETQEVETHAVSNVSLTINEGDYLAIKGPSGSGKSTLLSLIGLLDRPNRGQVLFDGKDTTVISQREAQAIRQHYIGFVFQSFHLLSELTVFENIALPLVYSGLAKSIINERVKYLLSQLTLSHRENHKPFQLSGGQQQRVAIARALAVHPKFLILDEPTGNLDSKNSEIVMNVVDGIHREGTSIILVTHEPRYTAQASRTIEIVDGRVEK